jgi:hypothetical protein
MGTTEKSTQSNTYNPQSMGTFNSLMSGLGQVLPGFMNNPFGTQQFKMGQQLGTSQANNLNQTGMSGLLQNMTGSGMAGGASNPAATEMIQNQARAGTANTANLGFIQPTQNALQMQQNALGTAAGFKPLQTGGTNTQSTGGLGTWLPQLASGLLGAAGGAAGIPGLGGLFGSMNPQMQGFQGGNINGALPTGSPGSFLGMPGLAGAPAPAGPSAAPTGSFFGQDG